MKKTIFTLALLAGLSGAAQAQRNISLGLKAGGTYSSYVGEDADNLKGLFGFHAGGFVNIGLTKLFAFQPEIIYSQKGTKYDINEDVRQRLHYLDIPLAFHVNADGLFFEAGPQVGVLLAASGKAGSFSNDIKNNFNDFDFGYLVGLGYQRKAGPGIGLRYNGGFVNNTPSAETSIGTLELRRRNSAFQLYLTYSFGGR
ncbi:porin family protein [Hymenobacter sp. ASUV-10]|uniref:Porin family protein n=1 Tax=Hymenobacter aranciens TaxID=3063996 RepID=A0ABT9BGM7_9BACT|nr:porin family protein [Hymenobacter sp. ASUV-10]MDO7876818.1 porin family protein [Hymenobacter sp. ASUV-10]